MTQSSQHRDRPRYPLSQAFVVQVQGVGGSDAGFLGRIEHVSSGETIEFASGEALLFFIAATMRRISPRSDQERDP